MSSDVFVLSSARDPSASTAIRRAAELAGVSLSRIQDAVFGLKPASSFPDLESISRSAGLTCPSVGVSSSLRALAFSADSILSDDAGLTVVIGLTVDECVAVLLASPETVGRLNLLPPARLAARSLNGAEPALRLAGINSSDVQICKDGDSFILLHALFDELESQTARWGLISSANLTLLIERI